MPGGQREEADLLEMLEFGTEWFFWLLRSTMIHVKNNIQHTAHCMR